LSEVKIQENRKEESRMSTLDALILTSSKALWFLLWVQQGNLWAVEVCCIG